MDVHINNPQVLSFANGFNPLLCFPNLRTALLNAILFGDCLGGPKVINQLVILMSTSAAKTLCSPAGLKMRKILSGIMEEGRALSRSDEAKDYNIVMRR